EQSHNAPIDFWIMAWELPHDEDGPYIGRNWQDVEAHDTITVTERRFLSVTCPYCQQDFYQRAVRCKVSVRTRRMHRLF
ncbi:MAG: hypothetical protein ACKPKO_40525, partial [Candidatus Fonsibacter sp.]